MNTIRSSICLTIITMVLCGFLFPLAITLIGQIFFYQQANGSLIKIKYYKIEFYQN
ncbi:potassium-transporting ATPase subunit C [Staphylococcus aureus]